MIEDRKLIIENLERKVEKLTAEMEDAVKLGLYDKAAMCKHKIEAYNDALVCVNTL